MPHALPIHHRHRRARGSPRPVLWWWRDAIEEHQPRLVVCGHDHRTSIRNGIWQDEIGQTAVINVGQNMDGPLHATLVVENEGMMGCERIIKPCN